MIRENAGTRARSVARAGNVLLYPPKKSIFFTVLYGKLRVCTVDYNEVKIFIVTTFFT